MTDPTTELTPCLICGKPRDQHDTGLGLPVCRGIAVPTYIPSTRSPANPEQVEVTLEQLGGYQWVFNAVAAAVTPLSDKSAGISVQALIDALNKGTGGDQTFAEDFEQREASDAIAALGVSPR